MKYPLQQWDHFIYKALHPSALTTAIRDGSYTPSIWNDALVEDENVRINLLQQLSLAKKKNHLSAYTNTAHIGCINLCATLSGYIALLRSATPVTANHQEMIQKYLALQNKIRGTIGFIEQNFGIFCPSLNLGYGHLTSVSIHEARLRFLKLKANLQQRCGDTLLLHIALSGVENFFDTQVLNVSNYRHFLYCKEYIYHLEKLHIDHNANNIAHDLKNCLLLINYNKFSFIRYLMTDLRTQVQNIEPASAKICQWYVFLKEFKQLQHIPQYTLFPASPSLKKLIAQNIQEEINYYKKSAALKELPQPTGNTPVTAGERLSTSLSVAQLALFIRLAVDAGMLQSPNHAALLRKVAASVKTAKADSISEESLRIKFYSPQLAAVNIVKEYLLKMIGILRSY